MNNLPIADRGRRDVSNGVSLTPNNNRHCTVSAEKEPSNNTSSKDGQEKYLPPSTSSTVDENSSQVVPSSLPPCPCELNYYNGITSVPKEILSQDFLQISVDKDGAALTESAVGFRHTGANFSQQSLAWKIQTTNRIFTVHYPFGIITRGSMEMAIVRLSKNLTNDQVVSGSKSRFARFKILLCEVDDALVEEYQREIYMQDRMGKWPGKAAFTNAIQALFTTRPAVYEFIVDMSIVRVDGGNDTDVVRTMGHHVGVMDEDMDEDEEGVDMDEDGVTATMALVCNIFSYVDPRGVYHEHYSEVIQAFDGMLNKILGGEMASKKQIASGAGIDSGDKDESSTENESLHTEDSRNYSITGNALAEVSTSDCKEQAGKMMCTKPSPGELIGSYFNQDNSFYGVSFTITGCLSWEGCTRDSMVDLLELMGGEMRLNSNVRCLIVGCTNGDTRKMRSIDRARHMTDEKAIDEIVAAFNPPSSLCVDSKEAKLEFLRAKSDELKKANLKRKQQNTRLESIPVPMTESEGNAFYNRLRQVNQVTEQCPSVGETYVSFKGATINIGVTKSTPASDKIRKKKDTGGAIKKGSLSIAINYPVNLVDELDKIVGPIVQSGLGGVQTIEGRNKAVGTIVASIKQNQDIKNILHPTSSSESSLFNSVEHWDRLLNSVQISDTTGHMEVPCLCGQEECDERVRKSAWFLTSISCHKARCDIRYDNMGLCVYDDQVTGEEGRRVVYGSDSFDGSGISTSLSRLIKPLQGTHLGKSLVDGLTQANKNKNENTKKRLKNDPDFAMRHLENKKICTRSIRAKKRVSGENEEEHPDLTEFVEEKNVRRTFNSHVLPLIEKGGDECGITILDAGRNADGSVKNNEHLRWLCEDRNPILVMPDGSNISFDYVGSGTDSLVQIDMAKIPSDSGAKSSQMELKLLEIMYAEHIRLSLNRVVRTHNTDDVASGSNNMRYTIVLSIKNLKSLLDEKLIAINKDIIASAYTRMTQRFPMALVVHGSKRKKKK